jgi:hypothetical protein
MASFPYPRLLTRVHAQADESFETERDRSNHATQIRVPGPANVRINTWSGNLFYPVPILTIPGRGLPIALVLSYNSSWREVATPYGFGWQLSYNMFYVRDERGDIVIAWEDGRTDRFIQRNGAFLSPVERTTL